MRLNAFLIFSTAVLAVVVKHATHCHQGALVPLVDDSVHVLPIVGFFGRIDEGEDDLVCELSDVACFKGL